MKYAYILYDNYIFRFNPNKMMFRKNSAPIKFFRELPGCHKNGDPLSLDEMLQHSNNWNQYTAQMYWGFYYKDNYNRFKEFYKLFDEEGNMKHYVFFYTDNFTFRMSKGVVEAYNKETKDWGIVLTYNLDKDYNFKSLNGITFTNKFDFMKDVNEELMNFINYEKTSPRFLEFLKVIEDGVNVEEDDK